MNPKRIVGIASLILVGSAAGALAQAPCSAAQYNSSAPKSPGDIQRLHPSVSRARFAASVDSGKWVQAMGALGADAARGFTAAKLGAADSTHFMIELDSVIRALQSVPNDNSRASYVQTVVRPDRFNPDRDATGVYSVFNGANEINASSLNEPQAQAVCWAAMSADMILFRFALPLESAAIQRLSAITTSWMNYRTHGYSRQPLELLVQRGSLRDTLPPIGQLILAHLSAGGEITAWGGRIDSLAANETAVVEVLGGIAYWHNYTRYAGASVIVGLASNRPAGAGALFHFGPGLRGGALVRRESNRTTVSALMSADVYGLFESSKQSVEQGFNVARSLVLLPGRGRN
jgi:hypothetical protein